MTWWRKFIKMEVELTRGVPGPAWGENKAIWEKNKKKLLFLLETGGCDP